MEIIGCSQSIIEIKKLIAQVAVTQANVLISGESGTGKELVARTIHANSLRSREVFMAVNCAAIPADLLESELFGHERGAFTGAIAVRRGRFELANKGTIFLDEIGEMPLIMQAKLLRVLQEKNFERIGSNTTINTDMRVIAATNCDLEAAVKTNNFREDLYYRLNVFPIIIPALRTRSDDTALLIDYFMYKFNQQLHTNCTLTTAAKQKLCQYDWPGNTREISNIMERLCILYPQHSVDVADLPKVIINLQSKTAKFTETILTKKSPLATNFNLKQHIAKLEQELILAALRQTNWVVAKTATILGLRRTTLIEKMKKYELNRNIDEVQL